MAKKRLPHYTFQTLVEHLRTKSEAIICNNTKVVRQDERDPTQGIGMLLHGHKIAILFPNDYVAIRDCGWVTTTTYDRLKRVLPPGWQISRKGGRGVVWSGNSASDIWGDHWTLLTPNDIRDRREESVPRLGDLLEPTALTVYLKKEGYL